MANFVITAKPEASDQYIVFRLMPAPGGGVTAKCLVHVGTLGGPPGHEYIIAEYNYPSQAPVYPNSITNPQFTACLKAWRDKAIADNSL